MFINRVKIFFVLLLVTIQLFSANIDKTIVLDNNTTLYKQLLHKISKTNSKSDSVLVQMSILQELIHDSSMKTPTVIQINNVSTLPAYKNLFFKYLQNCEKIALLQTKIKNINKNINTIEKEINVLNLKSPTLLTNELQDAFYHKKKSLFENSLQITQKELSILQTAMQNSLKNFSINKNNIQKDIKNSLVTLKLFKTKMNHLSITIQQEELLNKKKTLRTLNDKLQTFQQKYRLYAIDLISNKFLLFCAYLQEKDNKVFDLQKELLNDTHTYNILNTDTIQSYLSPFLLTMETTFMGKLKTLEGSSEQEVKAVVDSTWQLLQMPLFHINTTPISIIKLIISIIIFILGLIVGHLYKKNIQKLSQRSRTITASTSTLLSNLGYYAIFLITFFIVLKFLGIDLSSIALIAGALSVGIGFGLQNIISNFVSGIILMVERSIKIGDYIQLDENLRGKVVDIKMRSITIVTNSNIDVIVPNQDLIQQKVINWTMHDRIRRFEIPFDVAYGTNAKKVIALILQAVKTSGFTDIYTQDKNKTTRVIMTNLGDSSVNFELFVWIKGAETLYPKRTTSRFLVLIYETLNENGIDIPFPQRDLHIKSIQTEIPINIQKEKT
ncbi:mechanosensitive ion channel family protein [Sulfurimonas sp.]